MLNLDKELVLHGIGKGYLETVTGKIAEVKHGQNLKLDVKATMTDVEGGDSLFPIYTFISKKEGTIEIDSATFSVSQLGIAQGVEYKTSGVKRMIRVLRTKTDANLGTSFTGVCDVICLSPEGKKVEVITTGTAGADQVLVSTTGELTYGSGLVAGEFTFWAKVDAVDAIDATMLKDAMPEVSSFSWMFTPGDMEGGKYQIDIYARRVRADGGLTVDTARDKASVQKLTLKILDPGDGSVDFARIVVSKVA